MKQTKLISLLLVLCMVAALLVPGTVAMEAKAADGEENDGLVLNKTAVPNDDGTYTITLEAYATGASTTISTSKDKPTDIILVLDQSGSMADRMSVYSFKEYSNRSNGYLHARSHNEGSKNLYYQLEDGSYAAVSVTFEDKAFTYTEITNGKNNSTQDGATNYYRNRDNLYAKVNGEYLNVTLTRDREWYEWDYTYTYTLPDGTVIADGSRGDTTSPTFSGIDGNSLYLRSVDKSRTEYTYSYVVDGVVQEIEISVGENTIPENTFYERDTSDSVPRLAALKSAVTAFADSVYAKAAGSDGVLGTDDDIDHRIAVVGFGSKRGYGNNTELLSISGNNSGRVGVAYNSISEANYVSVLQDVSTQNGQNMVDSAINALDAEGATQADLGMEMAQRILAANPVPDGEERNRVVILFTDGSPTSFDGFEKDVADDAIAYSQSIRSAGAEVYAVGIFDGADATSEGNVDGNVTQKSNWFMQNVSSNGGTPQSPSYYLSAADAGTLSSIFQQIAGSIESGGTTVKLDENSVIRDVISPYFKLPDGATPENISLSLVPYTGENQWGKSEEAAGVTAEIGGTDRKNISVTGFDFSENWCGPRKVDGTTNYAGKKLVISFNVVPKDGFLGGNNVPTNANAGVYENSDKTEPLKNFPVPEVNVPIKNITVTAKDKNVYLLGDLTKEQLTSGATVKAGENIEITFDPTAVNYGLESWQNAFVKIETSLTDSENKPLDNGFTDLKKDTDYHLTVTVSPKEEAKETSDGTPADEKTGSATGKVNVFKPEITWQDSQLNSGETPDYKTENFVKADWKHGGLTYTKENMTGEEPTLTYTYDPVEKALTEETPVKVAVMIDNCDVTTDTFFLHDECTFDNCKWETEYEGKGYHFVVHLDTFDLTITKRGCNETLDPHQTFVFTVTGPNGFSMEVVIEGNGSTTITNLPAGDYTVTEDTGWSWRYEPVGGDTRRVTAQDILNGEASVEFVNTRDDDHWLDGNAYCENKFTGIPATK